MRYRSLARSLPLLLSGPTLVLGQQAGDPAAGQRFAEASCLSCHGSAAAVPNAPAVRADAAMPSNTARSLDVFLRTSHPPMPNLILSATQRDDVIAYILSLR